MISSKPENLRTAEHMRCKANDLEGARMCLTRAQDVHNDELRELYVESAKVHMECAATHDQLEPMTPEEERYWVLISKLDNM
jgi:hypothetical protein